MEPAWNLSGSLSTFSLWGVSQAIAFRGQEGEAKNIGEKELLKY